MFAYKKYEFKKNIYLSKTLQTKKIRQNRFGQISKNWPYEKKKRFNIKKLKLLHMRRDITKDRR